MAKRTGGKNKMRKMKHMPTSHRKAEANNVSRFIIPNPVHVDATRQMQKKPHLSFAEAVHEVTTKLRSPRSI